MARTARKKSSTGNYLIKIRGEELFREDEDKKVFEKCLAKYFDDGHVYGFFISHNMIEIVAKENECGISQTMKPILTSYARYFNRTYNRTGKFYTDRFMSEPLETPELLTGAIKNLGKCKQPKKHLIISSEKIVPLKERQVISKTEPAKKQKPLPAWLL